MIMTIKCVLPVMANFDERSGIVPCKTEWGIWWQTIDEVFIEINTPPATKAKEIKCQIKPKQIKVEIQGKCLFEGTLTSAVHADEAIWTFEDKKLLRICLPKTDATAKNCWKSLLVNAYEADPFTFDQMEQKQALHRFQLENPGMDFSGATMTGNYHQGGPDLPS